MIITRTPLRISLGGGGTDLPHYYRNHDGGFLIAGAISKYVFVALNRNFDDDILLKYSKVERAQHPSQIEHPLLRELLLFTQVHSGIEISSMADIPTGTGLGSSGSFTVGVLRALRAYRHDIRSNFELAEEACHVEIDRLGEPVGKQDQFIAAIGGITAFEFHPDDRVTVMPLELTTAVRHSLEDNLLLFYTGVRRSASEVLEEERQADTAGAISLKDNLREVREIGRATLRALKDGDLALFGELLTQQWGLKLKRAPSATHDEIDDWIRGGIGAGARGGKLVGAGGGGFLLFYTDTPQALRDSMAAIGLEEIRFDFDYQGSTTIIAQ